MDTGLAIALALTQSLRGDRTALVKFSVYFAVGAIGVLAVRSPTDKIS